MLQYTDISLYIIFNPLYTSVSYMRSAQTVKTQMKCFKEITDLLALVCDVYCDFFTFPFGILGQVWYLIVLIPYPCCLSYFA